MGHVGEYTPLPGHRFLVEFDGDAWRHERLLVWPAPGDSWYIYTADGDLYVEGLSLWKSVIALGPGLPKPVVVDGLNTVRFQTDVEGDEMADLIAGARAGPRARRGVVPAAPTQWMQPDGVRAELPARVGAGVLPVPGPVTPDDAVTRARRGRVNLLRDALKRGHGDDEGDKEEDVVVGNLAKITWRLAEPCSHFGELGVVIANHVVEFHGASRGVARHGAHEAFVEVSPPGESVEEFATRRRSLFDVQGDKAASANSGDALSKLRATLRGNAVEVEKPAGDGAVTPDAQPELDVRVLEVDYDSMGCSLQALACGRGRGGAAQVCRLALGWAHDDPAPRSTHGPTQQPTDQLVGELGPAKAHCFDRPCLPRAAVHC